MSALEEGVIVQLVAACIHVDDPRIREILDQMSPVRPRLVRSTSTPRETAPQADEPSE